VNQKEAAKEEAKEQLGQEPPRVGHGGYHILWWLPRVAYGGVPSPDLLVFFTAFCIRAIWMVSQHDFSDKSKFQTMRDESLVILLSNSQSSFSFQIRLEKKRERDKDCKDSMLSLRLGMRVSLELENFAPNSPRL